MLALVAPATSEDLPLSSWTRLSLTDQKWNSLVKAGAEGVCHQKIWTNQHRALGLSGIKMVAQRLLATQCGVQGV